MRYSSLWVRAVVVLVVSAPFLFSQSEPPPPSVDSDLDGFSDELEYSLLQQFMPTFFTDQGECSKMPAEFQSGLMDPHVKAESATIYGQVFPAATSVPSQQVAELHFYHLWKQDCGSHGHPLDAEHVSVLVRSSPPETYGERWTALYWYAAAHEDTVCNVSQITRARTVDAELHGATVWISRGKHASFLDPELCHRGCGSDRCSQMRKLTITD